VLAVGVLLVELVLLLLVELRQMEVVLEVVAVQQELLGRQIKVAVAVQVLITVLGQAVQMAVLVLL
jgi:hypothetical protein